jgi:hypothetical protein
VIAQKFDVQNDPSVHILTEEKIISFLHHSGGALRPPNQGGSAYINGVPYWFTLMIYNSRLQEY